LWITLALAVHSSLPGCLGHDSEEAAYLWVSEAILSGRGIFWLNHTRPPRIAAV
jgi:hypothetical protein